jgi:asparagine synthase (glutamine-hydrolysing)
MERRGPDERDHWTEGSVALGHCMLRTTPESLEEHQPLTTQNKRLVLVWDGRLDNREELYTGLEHAGFSCRDRSDAELALQCYALWGEECPRHLLGDFAFAVWDAARQTLFCARDHFGARPFYFVQTERFFAFASEEQALLELPDVPRRPNEDFIATCFEPAFSNLDPARTWLETIRTLLPANHVSVTANGAARTETYWRLEPGDAPNYPSDDACQAAFLKVFGEAVRCRMRATGDIAAMMSGGMDSAGIAVMIKRHLPDFPGKAFHTYSAVSDHPEACVESQCIQTMTRDVDSEMHSVSIPSFTGMVSIQDLADAAWKEAHPVDNLIMLPTLMCLAAGRNGHRVLLHGACGDLTMYVPDRYPAFLMREGQWRLAWQECRDAARNNSFLRGKSASSLFAWNLGRVLIPHWLKPLARRLLGGRAGFRQSAINTNFSRNIRLAERLQAQRLIESKTREGSFSRMHAELLTSPWSGLSQGLSAYEHVAGRYGVELRDPWADKRVAEFFVNLPLRYRVRHGWTKYLARSAFAPYLDASVCWRIGKEHLGWPITRALMDVTDPVVADTLENWLGTLSAYVDRDTLMALYKRGRTEGDPAAIEFMRDMTALALWNRHILGDNTEDAGSALQMSGTRPFQG